ncbi:Crp/Fnr family transcriptional regulator [Crocinitomicaceae bacterium CZZ-1]|uniref:Crp/Fnr family transcriptional regulator n=1 Tax=Taishania pollutisoli TaxID=2766479 RepID=A0A8J6PHW4_9FLAO|nr:Crp/Fnr family transcriptional regulator [Taishania pollutisoli]MBC9811250.1 Crp/Fnr family transcriptional regulator [Taishania pollutisoli]MBX2947835.1 Crp/Fnr family transcriptional regulator [Crocinitomicaceae bacterium]NGF75033.1 Crp/Fnr family transcriptional regulator [Fluviicola sp. SGL-29]
MLIHSHKHLTCENCRSRKDSLFSHFNCEETACLNSAKSCNFYKKKQPIFLAGSLPRGVYCLSEGKVKVFSIGEQGKEQIVHIAKDGEIIGFRAMLSGDPYQVSAETLEDCNICFIAKDEFLNMIDTNPTLRDNVMKELSKELNTRTKLLTNMAQKSVRERLAFSLVYLDKVYSEESINLSREDLANFIGTATETLIRLLKDFKEEGLIEIHTRKLTLLNRPGLLRIAGD